MTETKINIEAISFKIQMLLAKANDPAATPQEAEAYAAKAEEMMAKYRIDVSEQRERGEVTMAPEWSEAMLGKLSSEWSGYYYSFATSAARHTGVRIKINYRNGDYVARVLGFGHDVAFFNLMFTSIMEAFSSKLEPRFNENEFLEVNALRMRQGGMERNRIAIALGLCYASDSENVKKAANRRVTKMIKEEAARQGHPELAEEVLGRSFNAKTYRESYARGFLSQLYYRLQTLAMANADNALVLKRTKEEVDEVWYQEYPADRPAPMQASDFTPCAKCAKAKSGTCREHSFRKMPERAINWSAVEKGRTAARNLKLDATNNRIGN